MSHAIIKGKKYIAADKEYFASEELFRPKLIPQYKEIVVALEDCFFDDECPKMLRANGEVYAGAFCRRYELYAPKISRGDL